MRILVVGAGAVGGYFGGRLAEKGEDVTFLVRDKREHQLKEHGLHIESVQGDYHYQPKTIKAEEKAEPFDVVILSTKAYHLKGAIDSLNPFVGENTMILPLLNGMSHVDDLIQAFGEEKVIGGLCFVESTLDGSGKVIQTSPIHDLVFGEMEIGRTGSPDWKKLSLERKRASVYPLPSSRKCGINISSSLPCQASRPFIVHRSVRSGRPVKERGGSRRSFLRQRWS